MCEMHNERDSQHKWGYELVQDCNILNTIGLGSFLTRPPTPCLQLSQKTVLDPSTALNRVYLDLPLDTPMALNYPSFRVNQGCNSTLRDFIFKKIPYANLHPKQND